MPKLDVYDLGQKGLDIVNSPVHAPDGTLLEAQNVQVSAVDEELALRKRDGMLKLNATTASGRVLAIYNVPLT